MNWQEVCEYPGLRNLPFKIELNERGQIVMSPAKVYHSLYQAELAYLLRSMLKGGKTLTECAVKTRKGTKVADAAWASAERLERIRHETECSIAPEICIEVISSGNTADEIKEKAALYFENGSEEVWICKADGTVDFYRSGGKSECSALVPNFPKKIEV